MLETPFLGLPVWIWIILALIIVLILLAFFFIKFLKNNWLLIAAISCLLYFNKLRKNIKTKQVANINKSKQTGYFHHTISFFKGVSGLIAIIGGIATIITLSPLFLTFLLGDDWFHIMLTSTLSIQTLDAIIIATNASAFFIYCIFGLILIRWLNKIYHNKTIHLGEKFFSFVMLLGFVVAIISIIFFLLTVWYTRRNIVTTLFSVTGLIIFVDGFAFFLVISGIIMMSVGATDEAKQKKYSLIISFAIVIFLIVLVFATMIYPAIISNENVYSISTDYAKFEPKNVSFQINFTPEINGIPLKILLQPNLSEFKIDDINAEYTNCHWSTNYGYFITLDNNLFIQKHSNDFILLDCPSDDTRVYWTYDLSDYSKNKPPFIISLQVENSNQKSAHNNLGEQINYILGNYNINFTWINQRSLVNTSKPIF
jgi:hypothetical protein